jgi:hypothetical protein
MAAAPEAAYTTWPLSPELTAAVLVRLPSQAWLCARAVCRDWRATLSDSALWRAADASVPVDRFAPPYAAPEQFVDDVAYDPIAPRATAAALFAAAARAPHSLLTELDASGCVPRTLRFSRLLQLARHARPSVLRAHDCACDASEWEQRREPPGGLSAHRVAALMMLADRLQRLEVDARCGANDAARLAASGFPVLHVRRLSVVRDEDEDAEEESDGDEDADEARLDALAAAVRGHLSLTQLCVTGITLPPERAVELCGLALQKRLTSLCLTNCWLTAALVPALARLLREGRLAELALRQDGDVRPSLWADSRAWGAQPAVRTLWTRCAAERDWRDLCAAIRASATLRRLTLSGLMAGARWALGPLLGAVTAHPTLQELCFSTTRALPPNERWRDDDDDEDEAPPQDDDYGVSRWVPDALVHGRALSRIIAANAPALRSLCYDGFLGEPGLEAALPALAANTNLQLLGVWGVQRAWMPPHAEQPPVLRECFVTDVMRPALRASASLRAVRFVPYNEALPDEQDADDDSEEEEEEEDAPEPDKAQRLRNALAALAQEVAVRHGERRGARDWARATSRWPVTAPATMQR